MNGRMLLVIILVLAAIYLAPKAWRALLRAFDWLIDHGDPFAPGLSVDAAQAVDLGPRPEEIACDPCPFPPAAEPVHLNESWHQAPETSPAPPPARAPRAPAPGDEAAGNANPPASPPPLPVTTIAQAARIEAAAPGRLPFAAWDPTVSGSDEFVEEVTAIRDHDAQAACDAIMASHHTPLGGA